MDLWSFGEGAPRQLEDSDADNSDGDVSDEEDLLPQSKRRCLAARRPQLKATALALDDSEPEAADSDDDLLADLAPAPPTDITNLAGPSPPPRPAPAPQLDARTQALLERNRALQERLRLSTREAEVAEEDLLAAEEEEAQAQAQPEQPRTHDAAPPAPGDGALKGSSHKLKVKLQSAKGHVVLLMVPTEPLGKMFEKYSNLAVKQGWLPSLEHRVVFKFDGDTLEPTQTLAALDCEDGDCIDVFF